MNSYWVIIPQGAILGPLLLIFMNLSRSCTNISYFVTHMQHYLCSGVMWPWPWGIIEVLWPWPWYFWGLTLIPSAILTLIAILTVAIFWGNHNPISGHTWPTWPMLQSSYEPTPAQVNTKPTPVTNGVRVWNLKLQSYLMTQTWF